MAQSTQTVGGAAGAGTSTCKPIAHSLLGKPQKLETHPQVWMSKVFVGHLDEPAAKGKVMLTFFPTGYAERGVVQLSAGATDDPEQINIVLHPTSGRVELIPGKWRDAQDFIHNDAEGKSID